MVQMDYQHVGLARPKTRKTQDRETANQAGFRRLVATHVLADVVIFFIPVLPAR